MQRRLRGEKGLKIVEAVVKNTVRLIRELRER